jgi:hypothetical protein
MGFLDDLGKGLNKVGKRTSDMAAVAKLKLEITKHKSGIDKKYETLGSKYYLMAKEGGSPDESMDILVNEINELFQNIENVQAEINKLNAEAEPVKEDIMPEENFNCSSCGITLKKGTKFCGGCGEKVEEIPVPEPAAALKKCPNCDAEVGDAKFCNACGTSLE